MVSSHAGTAHSATVRARFARALAVLYLTRTVVSLTWVATVALVSGSTGSGGSLAPQLWVWLALYPIADAAATAIEIRTTPHDVRTIAQPVNLVASVAAAAALVAATTRGFTTAIYAFGIWAIVSGSIQLFVALRRNPLLRAQWLMVISGAGSIFAGATFVTWHGTVHNGLGTLVRYSTGGAVWYLLAAIWIFAAARRTPTESAHFAGRAPGPLFASVRRKHRRRGDLSPPVPSASRPETQI